MKKFINVIVSGMLVMVMVMCVGAVPAFAAKDKMIENTDMSYSSKDCYEWAKKHYDDSLWDMPELERYNYIVDYVNSNVQLMSNEEILSSTGYIHPDTGKGDTYSMTSCIAELSKLAGLKAEDLRYGVRGSLMGVVAVSIDNTVYYTDIWFYANGHKEYKCSDTRWSTHLTAEEECPNPVLGTPSGGLGFTAADLAAQ